MKPVVTAKDVSDYSAHHLSVLEGLEAVRKRPAMYIGSTDHRGLMHCLWEIIDNSVDEALAGFCDHIEVFLYPDYSAEVRDNGRGVPVDEVPGTGLSGVEVVYTKLHAGGKFDSGLYKVAGGLHGVGASVVNALSARMDVQVDRGGLTQGLQFRRGEPGVFTDPKGELNPNNPFQPFEDSSKLTQIGKVKKGTTGTRVRFWADFQIFPKSTEFSFEDLKERARKTSFLVPGLTITVNDLRGEEHQSETYLHKGGTVDYVDYLAPDTAITDTWQLVGSGTFTETVQVLNPKTGHLEPKEMERTCEVDVALRWGIGYDTVEQSYVNIIETPVGGTHLAGFEAALVKTMRAEIQANSRKLKLGNKDTKIEKEDILAGMTAVITVRLPEPEFEGQTKEALGSAQVKPIVTKVVSDRLAAFLHSKRREDKTQVSALLEKIVAEMRSRLSARLSKEITRRKNALETSTLPTKLVDCRSNDVEQSELFIVEGDSALGTAKAARNSEFQALFPIRGKILNVQKTGTAQMLANAECAAIIQVLGAGSGRTFDLNQARYGKVIMMTDADVDGAHIRTLLLTLFFRYMRPMIAAGRVYAAVPPLHRIQVNAKGKTPGEFLYTYSEDQLHKELAKLEKTGRTYKEPIQRYKGLGEMDADQLAETTMEPHHRTLRRIRLSDEGAVNKAEEVFEILMGSSVPPRREFIVEGAAKLDAEMIDA
ncbi:DNA topoisomerase IV subunit B [Mobiluncus porci]|uniref:DNA gyrase/topoisomerase IV subunit B n=1 Tax=Mobiluncus porci TaxID=2652278 RepID=UPI0030B86DC5